MYPSRGYPPVWSDPCRVTRHLGRSEGSTGPIGSAVILEAVTASLTRPERTWFSQFLSGVPWYLMKMRKLSILDT